MCGVLFRINARFQDSFQNANCMRSMLTQLLGGEMHNKSVSRLFIHDIQRAVKA